MPLSQFESNRFTYVQNDNHVESSYENASASDVIHDIMCQSKCENGDQ